MDKENSALNELIDLRSEWQENINILTQAIDLLNKRKITEPAKPVFSPDIKTGHNGSEIKKKQPSIKFSSLSIDERIMTIIKQTNRFLFRTEIESIAKEMGKPFKNMIASSLSAIRTKGQYGLVLFRIEHNKAVWGLESWLNEHREIRPEHMYDLKLVE